MSIEDLVNNQGELAITFEAEQGPNTLYIEACAQLPANATRKDIAAAYLSLCDIESPTISTYFSESSEPSRKTKQVYTIDTRTPLAIFAGKKYKPVAHKIRPVETELPSRFWIIRDIKGDLLADMPQLLAQPPEFTPTGRYTQERMEQFTKVHEGEFLLPEEKKLVHHFMSLQNGTFTWTDQE